jgi:hypothetical protein
MIHLYLDVLEKDWRKASPTQVPVPYLISCPVSHSALFPYGFNATARKV